MPTESINIANTTFVSSAQPYTNLSFYPLMYIGEDPSFQSCSGLLQFTLPTIPASAVDSAVLQFSLIVKSQATPTVVTVNRAATAFSTNTVTYNTQPIFIPTASQVSVNQSDLYQRVSIDITALVNAWLAGTYENYGIVLTGVGGAVQFATNAIVYQPYFPTLTLTYSSTPPTPDNSAFCFCYAQLSHVIQQLMTLYPTSTMRIYTTGDVYTEGVPYKFYASPDATYGTLAVLMAGGVYGAVPITTIVAVRVAGTNYDNSITYLTPPVFTSDCQKNVVTSIHDYLPVSTGVTLSLNGFIVATGVAYKNEYGILAVAKDMAGTSPVFVPATSVTLIETTVPLSPPSPSAVLEPAERNSEPINSNATPILTERIVI
jgi:hypothetical protein